MLSIHYIPPHSQYVINETDSLFWCFYILKEGYKSYEIPGNVSFTTEKEQKYKCIDKIKNSFFLLKQHKIKNSNCEIEDDIANNSTISIKTFIALCLSFDIEIFFIEKNKYFETKPNPINVVFYENSIATILHNADIEKYYSKYYKWDNISRPIKAISGYTRQDLFSICDKLGLIESISLLTKSDLYNMLSLHIT